MRVLIFSCLLLALANAQTDCVGFWGMCDTNCQSTYTITQPAENGGAACSANDGDVGTFCQPGMHDCPAATPVDCVGFWSMCDTNCQSVYTITTPAENGGAACSANDGDVGTFCQPGMHDCPAAPVDCVGHWSRCNANCQSVYTITTPAENGGAACSDNDGDIYAGNFCQPGVHDCPAATPVDCVGYWSRCDTNCQSTYTIGQPAENGGAACSANDGDVGTFCQPGVDDCPAATPDWVVGTFGSCSVTCNYGTKIRTVACSTGIDADCVALGLKKPHEEEQCYAGEYCNGGNTMDMSVVCPTGFTPVSRRICTHCKCKGAAKLAAIEMTKKKCKKHAVSNGKDYFSWRKNKVQKDTGFCFVPEWNKACGVNRVSNTKMNWSIYIVEQKCLECSNVVATELCSQCKCGGLKDIKKRKTILRTVSREKCADNAFKAGYKYFSWKEGEGERYCYHGERYSSEEACIDDRITTIDANWYIFEVSCQ